MHGECSGVVSVMKRWWSRCWHTVQTNKSHFHTCEIWQNSKAGKQALPPGKCRPNPLSLFFFVFLSYFFLHHLFIIFVMFLPFFISLYIALSLSLSSPSHQSSPHSLPFHSPFHPLHHHFCFLTPLLYYTIHGYTRLGTYHLSVALDECSLPLKTRVLLRKNMLYGPLTSDLEMWIE